MKIEIWSDYMCPFCYIGKRRFEEALESFPHKDQVEVVYRSYELNPNEARYTEQTTYDSLAKKYGMSAQEAKSMTENVVAQARTVGLNYNFDVLKPTNSFDAHRLTHYAAEQGKASEMTESLFSAYFEKGEHIGSREVLIRLAGEVGMDTKQVERMLEESNYAEEVRRDEKQGADLGIQGVPFFVIDRKYGISGAQPLQVFTDALTQAWSESQPLKVFGDSEDALCKDDSCSLPDK
ncbi:DsbA family oxidoreductase [Paenibacillus gallinarum]|uniref:DsbA family oxidoreductase n=1 Tax=Paenibacillus gallinarum TaxID=2762232 RepID=A0ABR8T4X0_9BACL|nr:DsbA family oxidoreductase [Paenibacillus gallinarum]MBD7970639.1 DsbA family oxidoreductase [Paenibacillus gallinarum]